LYVDVRECGRVDVRACGRCALLSNTHFCIYMCILHTTSLPYTVYMKYLSLTHITHTHTLTHRDEDAAWNKTTVHAHDATDVRPAGA
jgi:hypothetical protein